MRRGTAWAAALLVSAAVLTGCRPLYIPLVPEAPRQAQMLRLGTDSQLEVVAGRPRLTLNLTTAAGSETDGGASDATTAPESPADGAWLDVQWFGPTGAQAASESQWFQPGAAPQVLIFSLPADIDAVAGEWRAVVSTSGRLLRQFRVDVTADPEP